MPVRPRPLLNSRQLRPVPPGRRHSITDLRQPSALLDPQVAQQPVERLGVGVVLLPAGEVADAVAKPAGQLQAHGAASRGAALCTLRATSEAYRTTMERDVQDGGAKRPRTYFVVRQRYKRARWVAAGVGVLVAVLAIAMALTRLEVTGFDLDTGSYLGAAVLLLAAIAVPWLIVEGLWQWARRRHFWDWQ